MELRENIRVAAFDIATGVKVGEYDSISSAARKLFIRTGDRVYKYIFGKHGSTFTGKRRGVGSYKTDTKYHFEKI